MGVNFMNEVLLVEQNAEHAQFISQIVKQAHPGAYVEVVTDGREALDFLMGTGNYSHRAGCPLPKLVLLDMNISQIKGREVLQILRAYARTRTLPVVVFTDEPNNEDLIAGANSCIVKSSNTDEFAQSLELTAKYWLMVHRFQLTPERNPWQQVRAA
jgi:two-component system, response regulator